jgi:hypothetical protein
VEAFALLRPEKRGSRRSLFFGFDHSFHWGEHRVIVKLKSIFAPGGQRRLLDLGAVAAETQLTNSWISNPSDFCPRPIVTAAIQTNESQATS